jgi:regulation of enolase protein 1 (concanavalin A-like superfamily)
MRDTALFTKCRWLNEPKAWSTDGKVLTVLTDQGTDFWRETHYGFTRDSGHAFLIDTDGDFTAESKIEAKYRELYDQAGIMIRIDDKHWLKSGVEFNDGSAAFSSVLTAPVSDWTTGPFVGNAEEFWIRATVSKGVLKLQYSVDGKLWPLARLCPFPEANYYAVGPMCCTPERSGLAVKFSEFIVSAPINKDLHDLT